MDAKNLKALAEKILSEFEESLNEIHTLSGYMYDHRKSARLQSVHYDQLIKNAEYKFKFFQIKFEKRFNKILEQTMGEMTSEKIGDNSLPTKFKFWNNILKDKPPEVIIKRYLEAATLGNKTFMYFIENDFIYQIKDDTYRKKLQQLIKKHKKSRITQSTKTELAELKKLYGFYLQTLKFTKNPRVSLEFIQDLFATLNRYYRVPIHKIIAKN